MHMEFVHPLMSKPIHIKTMNLAEISHKGMEKFQIIEKQAGQKTKHHSTIMP